MALDYLLYVFPDFLKRDGKRRMVYDADSGMWAAEDQGAMYRLAKKAHDRFPGSQYGESTCKLNSVWAQMLGLPDESQFFRKARANIDGKLLLQDCVFDKLRGEHGEKLPFTHELYFSVRVSRRFPTAKPPNTDKVRKWFADSFTDPKVADYVIQELVQATFGLGWRTLLVETGAGSGGKSKRQAAVQNCLGDLAVTMDGKDFAVSFQAAGQATPHLMCLESARIVFVSELTSKTKLNTKLLKQLTGDDNISGRDLNQGNRTFKSRAKICFLTNDIPDMDDCERSTMVKRFRQVDSTVQWLLPLEYGDMLQRRAKTIAAERPGLDEDALTAEAEASLKAEGVHRADTELTQECVNSPDEMLWILLNEPLTKLEECTPASVMKASIETVEERDDLRCRFKRQFDDDPSGKVETKELLSALQIEGPSGSKQLATRMKAWGYGEPKLIRFAGVVNPRRGYIGVKRKAREERQED
jgi:hypothetical protein